MNRIMKNLIGTALGLTLLYLAICFCMWHLWSPQDIIGYMSFATPNDRFDWMVIILLSVGLSTAYVRCYW